MFLKELANKYQITANINIHDFLVGITYDELITTIQANTEHPSPEDVRREFNNILQIQIKDAKHSLETNMDWIMKQVN